MVINVLHSIGDIIFCEPIYRHYWTRDGVKPKVVIRDHLIWLQDYIESAIFIKASKWNGDIDDNRMTDEYIPLRFANQVKRGYDKFYHDDFENCMLDKYRLVGLPDDDWKKVKLDFNEKKGIQLAEKLGLSVFEEYVLRNEHCQAGKIQINLEALPKRKRIVDMSFVDGFNVIDWFLIHAQADEIHTVSTSTFFIMQALINRGIRPWNSPDVFVYPRPNVDGLRGISQLNPDFNLIRVQ